MDSKGIICEIKSKYVLDHIFNFIEDKYYKLKVVIHSKYVKKKYEINNSIIQQNYLDKLGFDLTIIFVLLYPQIFPKHF